MESTDHDVMQLVWQYCRAGYDITTQFYAEQDADEARAWQYDFCFAAVVRDGYDPDRWRLDSSDGRLPDNADKLTFPSPADAVEYLAAHHGLRYVFTTAEQ